MKRLWPFSLVLLLVAALSCEDQSPMTENDQDLKEVNGRLVFKNHDAYVATLSSLRTLKSSELTAWQKENFAGFRSMKSAYENLSQDDKRIISEQGSNKGYENILTLLEDGSGEFEAVMNADVMALATLVNNQGVVQIGNEVIKVGYDDVRVAKFTGEEGVNSLNRTNWQNLPSDAKIIPVQRKITSLEGGRTKARVGTCEDRYWSDRRFRGELWVSNTAPVYSGTGARSKHQNRFLRVWWADAAPQIRLQVDGTFSQTGPAPGTVSQTISYDSGIEYNENIIEYRWEECFNVQCYFDASATVTSSGVGDNGQARGCTIF